MTVKSIFCPVKTLFRGSSAINLDKKLRVLLRKLVLNFSYYTSKNEMIKGSQIKIRTIPKMNFE